MRKRIHSTLALGAASLVAGAMLVGCSTGSGGDGGAASGEPLTLVTWGGTTEEGYKAAWADPFTEATGIPTEMVNPVDYGKLSAQIEADQVVWDWVDLEGWFTVQHSDWWAATNTPELTIDADDLITLPGAAESDADWALPSGSYSFVISYRTDAVDTAPSTWEEFFDTEQFPGKRGVYNWPYGMLEVALLADGVPFEELYPLDIDRALAKLDTVRDDLVFWNSGAELQQMMSSGEVDYSFAWNNRIAALAEEGQPVAIDWGENLQDGGYMVTAKNNPQLDETLELFASAITTETQTKMAEATGYSPILRSSFEALPAEDQPWYNVHPDNMDQAVGSINLQWWAENFDTAVEKWNSWAGQ
ncbi:extracellular solute-binding protein [Leucobacter rhizosphaerae]|uniref:Extracellular solute-binding protein n=1 Tax=Leucobacter rhizosphaerae TaxID=2932245 RepID=A0ABY4FTF8_9MICO|nr:extracellular solute-binding protein [Leucobacter rhizosphaerae]UOQ59585.1 extracellular solute-binding protein [Leucobacter rhizosphaerae]